MSTTRNFRQAIADAVPDFPLPERVAWVRKPGSSYHLPNAGDERRTRCGASVFNVTGGDQINFYDRPCARCFRITVSRADEISAAHVEAWNRAQAATTEPPVTEPDVWTDLPRHPMIGREVTAVHVGRDCDTAVTGPVVAARRSPYGIVVVMRLPDGTPREVGEDHVLFTGVREDVVWFYAASGCPRLGVVAGSRINEEDPHDTYPELLVYDLNDNATAPRSPEDVHVLSTTDAPTLATLLLRFAEHDTSGALPPSRLPLLKVIATSLADPDNGLHDGALMVCGRLLDAHPANWSLSLLLTESQATLNRLRALARL